MENLAVWIIVIGLGILFYMASRMGYREAVTKLRMAGNVLILFSEPIELKINKIAWTYFIQWNEKVTYEEFRRGFKVAKGDLQLSISVLNEPLQKGFVEFLSGPFYGLTENQISNLREQKSYIVIQGITKKKGSRELIFFITQFIMSVMREFSTTIGYMNASSQYYYPKDKIEPYLEKLDFSSEDFFSLYVGVQSIETNGNFHIHTHGLEQFGVPNLEIKASEQSDAEYCQSVINNTSIYLIANGDIIRSGSTLELMGDGVIFKAKLRKDKDFPTGVLHLIKA